MPIIPPTGVEEVFGRIGVPARFSPAEFVALGADRPRDAPGFLTYPTPRDNARLSVLGLREALGVDPAKMPAFFDHPWYLNEPFGRRPCAPGWHSVAMAVLPPSLNRPVYYAEELRPAYLPSATEVLLMLFIHFVLSGERLLLRKHTWTEDRTETTGKRRFVSIGAFGGKGVFVSSHEVGYKSRGLGICPAVDPLSLAERLPAREGG